MRDWSVATFPGRFDVRLHGRVEGHPEIDDPWVTTSSVLAIDAGDGEMGWARTAGRWYRVDLTSYRSVDGESVDEVLAQIARIAAGVRAGLTKAFAEADL